MTGAPWKIEWNDGLMLGIPEIDDDHQHFATLVNDLNAAIAQQADKAEIRNRLNLLYLDAKDHFQHEERLFALYAYPEHEQHAQIHRQIEDELLRELAVFVMSSTNSERVDSGLRIREILVRHFLDQDMKYREFLKSKMGIAPSAQVSSD
jgi:hemerythrin